MFTERELLELCVRNAWFTQGTDKQLEKLLYAHRMECSTDELATIIWLCSDEDVCRRDIIFAINEMKERVKIYEKPYFGKRTER